MNSEKKNQRDFLSIVDDTPIYRENKSIFNNYSSTPNRLWVNSGLMGYWLRGHEGERNNCFSKIQLVGQKYRDKTTLVAKCDSAAIVLVFKAGAFRY